MVKMMAFNLLSLEIIRFVFGQHFVDEVSPDEGEPAHLTAPASRLGRILRLMERAWTQFAP
jgi:hypothetical protein